MKKAFLFGCLLSLSVAGHSYAQKPEGPQYRWQASPNTSVVTSTTTSLENPPKSVQPKMPSSWQKSPVQVRRYDPNNPSAYFKGFYDKQRQQQQQQWQKQWQQQQKQWEQQQKQQGKVQSQRAQKSTYKQNNTTKKPKSSQKKSSAPQQNRRYYNYTYPRNNSYNTKSQPRNQYSTPKKQTQKQYQYPQPYRYYYY